MVTETEDFKELILHDETREILSRQHRPLYKWSIVSLFFLVIIFVIGAFVIKYPRLIVGSVIVTTKNLPTKILCRSAGRIDSLLVTEGELVKKGQTIAVIQSTLSARDVDFLKENILKCSNLTEPISIAPSSRASISLGSAQDDYNNLTAKVNELNLVLNSGYFEGKIRILQNQLNHFKKLESVLSEKIALVSIEVGNLEEKFKIDKKLFSENVLSKTDFMKSENDYLHQKEELENIRQYHEELGISRLDVENKMLEIRKENQERRSSLEEAIRENVNNIHVAIDTWKQEFALISPIDGHIFHLKNLSDKQFIQTNEELFSVVPRRGDASCIVMVPGEGIGKVRNNQQVRIKLDDYPYQEFGQLTGTVVNIPKVPVNDNGILKYRISIRLENGLRTTYNQMLELRGEMRGRAEIVTDRISLADIIFRKMHSVISN